MSLSVRLFVSYSCIEPNTRQFLGLFLLKFDTLTKAIEYGSHRTIRTTFSIERLISKSRHVNKSIKRSEVEYFMVGHSPL